MGVSGKWFKSLLTLKPLQASTNQEKVGDKAKKRWRLWRSSSEGVGSSSLSKGLKMRQVAASEASDSSLLDDVLAAAMATIVRAQPKDFRAVKREWAAIRIQTAFRALLARRALRALKAVVRIQAIFRGRQVRKQAVVTLRCMQALVRVQARVRARSVLSSDEQAKYHDQTDSTKEVEKRWCDSPGTLEELRAKQQTRQEGAIRRERAMAYSVLKQQSRTYASPNSRAHKQPLSSKHQKGESNSPNFNLNWLERWMATKPWETRMMGEDSHQSEMTTVSRKSEDTISSIQSNSSDFLNVRRNNVTTRIFARPPIIGNQTSSSLSAPSSESVCDEISTSTSYTSASPTTFSSNTLVAEGLGLEDNHTKKSSYMNPTESVKAKQKAFRFSSENIRSHAADDLRFHRKLMTLSCEDTRSCAGSNSSANFSREFFRPIQTGRRKFM